MTCTLVWQIKPKSSYKSLPCALKWILEKKVDFPFVVTHTNIPYFEGLRDSGIQGADELIDIIEQYGEIELNIEC